MIRQARRRMAGQGMTEYIIIVALVAIAAIGVYSAFGDIVRGQASVAAVALSGEHAQSERNHALQALRDRRARVCVAT